MPKVQPDGPPAGSLAATIAAAGPPPKLRSEHPVWAGPESDDPNGGVTFSLLSRFLCCRERFRLLVVEGLRPAEQFNHLIEFGNMFHVAEEAHGAGSNPVANNPAVSAPWERALAKYVKGLALKYPMQRDQINHWYDVCRATFVPYLEYWQAHADHLGRTTLFAEQEFSVPYRLPSGRTVRLRGKWDAGEITTKTSPPGLWLPENKTKSQIDDTRIARQLTFDLQTMIYVVAFLECQKNPDLFPKSLKRVLARLTGTKFMGVRYNVIGRSQHKSTSADARKHPEGFVGHLRDLIRADVAEQGRDNRWFARWQVEVYNDDVQRFRRCCLDPILEQLCDWWDFIKASAARQCSPWELHGYGKVHFQMPFGVYNPLLEGGSSDLDGYIIDGNAAGLAQTDNLFPELARGA